MYKVPFTALQAALYAALKDSDVGIEFFDAGVAPSDIENYYKDQSEYAYGVFGAATADADALKDGIVWTVGLDIEVYSNYRGRKAVADILGKLLDFLAGGAVEEINKQLVPEGFGLITLSLARLRTNLPVYSDSGIWQSGGTTLTFKMTQRSE